jgi:hypothetical protein
MYKVSENEGGLLAGLASLMQLGDPGTPTIPGHDDKSRYIGDLIMQARALRYLERQKQSAASMREIQVFPDINADKRYKGLLNKRSEEAAGIEKLAIGPLAALPWMFGGPLMAYFGYQGAKDALHSGSAAIADLRRGDIDAAVGDAGWTAFDLATTLPTGGFLLRALGKGLKAGAVSSKAGRALMSGDKALLQAAEAATRKNLEHMAGSGQAKKWTALHAKPTGLLNWPQKLLENSVGGDVNAAGRMWGAGRKLDENLALRALDLPNRLGFMPAYLGVSMGVPMVMGERGYEKRERELAADSEQAREKRKRKLAEQMGIPYFEAAGN